MNARLYELYRFHAELCREEARQAADPELCARWADLAAEWIAMIPLDYRRSQYEAEQEFPRRRRSM